MAAHRCWASTASASSATAAPATGRSRTPWRVAAQLRRGKLNELIVRSWNRAPDRRGRRVRRDLRSHREFRVAASPDAGFPLPASKHPDRVDKHRSTTTRGCEQDRHGQVAFLFPGQGAQTVGMGRQLAESLPAARQLFDEAARILGYDLARPSAGTARPSGSTPPSSASRPSSSPASPPSKLCGRRAAAAVAQCVATAGLSLGEYTALVFAGALSFRRRAARGAGARRGDAGGRRRHAQRHGQRPVGLEAPQVEELCAQARAAGPSRSPTCSVPATSSSPARSAACDEVERLVDGDGRPHDPPGGRRGVPHRRS